MFLGVVSIDSVRLILFLGQLNALQACAADCGNAFLHGMTHEKYYIIASPEFGELQGRILLIVRSLYGLKTRAARWHEFFVRDPKEDGLFPTKADPDIRI